MKTFKILVSGYFLLTAASLMASPTPEQATNFKALLDAYNKKQVTAVTEIIEPKKAEPGDIKNDPVTGFAVLVSLYGQDNITKTFGTDVINVLATYAKWKGDSKTDWKSVLRNLWTANKTAAIKKASEVAVAENKVIGTTEAEMETFDGLTKAYKNKEWVALDAFLKKNKLDAATIDADPAAGFQALADKYGKNNISKTVGTDLLGIIEDTLDGMLRAAYASWITSEKLDLKTFKGLTAAYDAKQWDDIEQFLKSNEIDADTLRTSGDFSKPVQMYGADNITRTVGTDFIQIANAAFQNVNNSKDDYRSMLRARYKTWKANQR